MTCSRTCSAAGEPTRGMSSSRVDRWRAFAALLVLAGAAGAPAQAAEFSTLEVTKEGKRYFVDSTVVMNACPGAVFHVLTDYDDDAFRKVSKVFVESRFLERDEQGNGLVYTKAKGCITFFCRELERVEQLTVEPIRHIEAVAIPERSDAKFSHARWTLDPVGEATQVTYTMEFEPDFWVPPLLGTAVVYYQLKKQARRAANKVEELAAAMECPAGPSAVAGAPPTP